ncbi:hypothetical protein [Acidisoma cladoniae]|uniref:hypothetical protein n=1 Tax=Acidisoma cladoniae TaxID=3040935 RepID=UPI00254A14DD|nr:hypothetical protein [Acidisoma sp. PAMC 29798]
MAICPFHWLSKLTVGEVPAQSTRWEEELPSILAAAEVAFDQLSRRCGGALTL